MNGILDWARNGDTVSDADRSLETASVSVENLSLSFGELSVLEDVSLAIEPGEFVGFIGPNGAGKTTLLRLISGALEPDSGAVTIGDVDVHDVPSKASSRLVSVVPQNTSLSFSVPVRDVVEMGRHPHRSRFSGPTPEDGTAVKRALERTRTAELAERPIDEVSGGQRQRVVLARAIAQETPVMLLDEPTASLDVNHQLESLELVRELVDEGRTVCAAIHDLDLAARYCDRLILLADGDIYRRGPPADVLTGDSIADVFDASAAVTRNPITGTETVTAFPDPGERHHESATDERAARVHVFGTGPTATGVLGRLEATAHGVDLSTGPVPHGSTVADIARRLEIDCLDMPPFESLSPAILTAFENWVQEADVTVVTESVLDSSGAGTRRLLESVDAVADSVVVVTRPDGASGELDGVNGEPDRASGDIDATTSRERGLEATPETILEALSEALEDGAESSIASFRSGGGSSESDSSETGSSDRDSESGLSVGSSSD